MHRTWILIAPPKNTTRCMPLSERGKKKEIVGFFLSFRESKGKGYFPSS